MAVISSRVLSDLFAPGDVPGATNAEKGKALEKVVRYLFEKVPGVVCAGTNEKNHGNDFEIDVCFQHNLSRSSLNFFEWMFFVECKNLSGPAGASAVHQLGRTLGSRGLSKGLLVSSNGLTGSTGDSGYYAIESEMLADRRHIVVLTREDIMSLSSTVDLEALLRRRFTYLVLNGTHEVI